MTARCTPRSGAADELAAELLEIPNNPALVRFQTSGYQETFARVQRIANEMERSGGFWVAPPAACWAG